MIDIFKYYKEKYPNKKILFKKKNDYWKGYTFQEIFRNVSHLNNFFKDSKIEKGDRVFLLSSNRIEWVEFDLAIMSAGAITVPSFVTNNVGDNNFIIKNCKPSFFVIENLDIYKKNEKILKRFEKSRIILIDNLNNNKKFYSYEELVSKESKKKFVYSLKKNDISTLIYTSGTSSFPKGVVLTHKSLIHNLYAALDLIGQFGIKNEKFISFLPLSHSYERMAGLYFPLLIGAEIYFCTSLEKLMTEIKEIKPTIFSAVPRLYENIYKKIKSQLFNSNIISTRVVKNLISFLENKEKNILKKYFFKFLINIFLKKKIKLFFGGKIKVFISGGAALNPTIGYFFNNLGITLLQGYGQTEASPLISCNTKTNNNPATVGFPVKNVLIKIARDDEIIIKGDNVMNGYWNDKVLTKKTIKKNWLHTGDLGFFDSLGRLIINGRKKDLIVTSGGDNISVTRIENLLTSQIGINQAVVFGDNKPYLVAIIVKDKNINKNKFKIIINRVNKQLNSIEKIKKYILAKNPLTYEDGLVTQTQKIKRDKVHAFFSKEINELYK